MGITVGDNAHHLGIAGAFFRKILDTLAGFYLLGNTFDIRIHAIGRDFSCHAIIALIHEIGVILFLDSAVDGQIAQLISAVINVHLAQCGLHTVSGKSRSRNDAQECYQNQ